MENTIYELADLITKTLGGELQVIRKPLPENDPQRRKPDITRAETLLGWHPVVPLAEGLLDTIAYFQKIKEEKDASGSPVLPREQPEPSAAAAEEIKPEK